MHECLPFVVPAEAGTQCRSIDMAWETKPLGSRLRGIDGYRTGAAADSARARSGALTTRK